MQPVTQRTRAAIDAALQIVNKELEFRAAFIRSLKAQLAQTRKDRDRYKRILQDAGVRPHASCWGGLSRGRKSQAKKHIPA